MSKREELEAVARRCETEEPSAGLDAAIGRAISSHNGAMWWTRRLSDAQALADEFESWMLVKGRLTPDEPLWGASVYLDEAGNHEIGRAETNASAASCLIAAILRARAALVTP